MKLWTWSVCLLLVAHVDATSSHTRKKLRSKMHDHDVDADDDDDDSETEQPAPAPAVATAPAAAVPAPAPVTPAEFDVAADEPAVEMHEMMDAAHEMFQDYNVSNPKDHHKEELAGLMYIEEVYEDKLDELDDETYVKKIEQEQIPVSNETSPGLASMLGEMREEMHEYAIPFYKKFLKAKLKELEEQQHKLVAEIAEEQEGKAEAVKEDEKEEEEPETTTAKPVEAKSKSKSHRSITTNNMMYGLAIVVVLCAIAFFLSRRGSAAART